MYGGYLYLRFSVDFRDEKLQIFLSETRSLDIWYVASPSGPLPSLFKLWPRPGGQMFYIGLYREKVKKSSCLKPQGLEP